jgi:hypothetical protein
VEVKLHDNSKINFSWTKTGALYVELYRPGNDRYGHGMLLTSSAMVAGDELNALLSFLASNQQEAA